MKKIIEVSEKIEIVLNFLVPLKNTSHNTFVGGVKKPNYIDELNIEVCEEESFDDNIEDFRKNGKMQVILGGSNRSLEELGKYLIAVSKYKTDDASYHDHFDDIKNFNDEARINLIVRKKG